MRNWSTNIQSLKKDSKQYAVWQLEQQLNFGLEEGEKINRKQLEKYLPILNIDQDTRNLMEFLLYGKKPSDNTTTKLP
ncbi:MAG: hypothetical protein LBT79_03315 [Elusimicrobiota bacterium]|jgi:hypothetical protein|nr:hypothetical protein [Elusimicrobiota bacterium]